MHLRLSDNDICIARYDRGRLPDDRDAFRFQSFPVLPRASLLVSLADTVLPLPDCRRPDGRVEVVFTTPATPIPLAEFQEEDIEAAYRQVFSPEEPRRLFYDPVPPLNLVLVFAADPAVCRRLEEAFAEVHYSCALTPVLCHFAEKGLGVHGNRRVFIYAHESVVDVALIDGCRLDFLNSYTCLSLSDVTYFTLGALEQLRVDPAEYPFFVAGDPQMRMPLIDELRHYSDQVYPINPAAEFNRHPIARAEGVPYDLVCAMLRR